MWRRRWSGSTAMLPHGSMGRHGEANDVHGKRVAVKLHGAHRLHQSQPLRSCSLVAQTRCPSCALTWSNIYHIAMGLSHCAPPASHLWTEKESTPAHRLLTAILHGSEAAIAGLRGKQWTVEPLRKPANSPNKRERFAQKSVTRFSRVRK